MTKKSELTKYRRCLDKKLAEIAVHTDQQKKAAANLEALDELLNDIIESQRHAQYVISGIQERVHSRIAGVVSSCLATVFDRPYKFKMLFERKRNRTEARCIFERDGLRVDPMTASGGGMVDVAAFALRLAGLLLRKPTPRKIIVMDEPFKFVSAEWRDNVRLLMDKLAADFGVQLIQVTHIEELVTGKVIRL
jgi:DNA repair exonuclease SbcCD ATPase subunit